MRYDIYIYIYIYIYVVRRLKVNWTSADFVHQRQVIKNSEACIIGDKSHLIPEEVSPTVLSTSGHTGYIR